MFVFAMTGFLRVAFAISLAMLGTTALADPPIINGGEAPQPWVS